MALASSRRAFISATFVPAALASAVSPAALGNGAMSVTISQSPVVKPGDLQGPLRATMSRSQSLSMW